MGRIKLDLLEKYMDKAMAAERGYPTDCYLRFYFSPGNVQELIAGSVERNKPLKRPHLGRDDLLNDLGSKRTVWFTGEMVPCPVAAWCVTDLKTARINRYLFGRREKTEVTENENWYRTLGKLKFCR